PAAIIASWVSAYGPAPPPRRSSGGEILLLRVTGIEMGDRRLSDGSPGYFVGLLLGEVPKEDHPVLQKLVDAGHDNSRRGRRSRLRTSVRTSRRSAAEASVVALLVKSVRDGRRHSPPL